MKKNILYLTLKAEWFWMIYEGNKPEEYRDLKEYWWRRLHDEQNRKRVFDAVEFKLGYHKNSPTMQWEYKGHTIGHGKPELGAPAEEVFIISLGQMLWANNIPESKKAA